MSNKPVIWIVLFSIVALQVTRCSRVSEEWEAYKERFAKHYRPEEDALRKEAFTKTNDLIKRHRQSNSTWTLAHNRFSDVLKHERTSRSLKSSDRPYGGIENKFLRNVTTPLNNSSHLASLDGSAIGIPHYLDYRLNPCMAPVKDHNVDLCKSDWAFAAIDPIEFKYCTQTGRVIALSEQQLIDCDPNSRGCLGGNTVYAWTYLMNSGGAAQEVYYPYGNGGAYVCRFYGQGIGARVLGFAYSAQGYPYSVEKSLVRYGPLATEMDVPLSFYYYSGGLYDDEHCGTGDALIALVLVGFGTSADGVPYWIARGSFGTWWGDDGYMYVRRGINLCSIEYLAAYVIVG